MKYLLVFIVFVAYTFVAETLAQKVVADNQGNIRLSETSETSIRTIQNEINMLINFDKFIRKPNILNKILKKKNKPRLRMKNKDEILMINNFEKFKKKFKKF